ncbi:MAG: hypothetical protein V3V06_08295 [Dehalococcoidia bacterium]
MLLAVLDELTRIASFSLNIQDSFGQVAEVVRRAIDFDILGMGLLRPESDEIEYPAVMAAEGSIRPGYRVKLAGSINGEVIQRGQPRPVRDAHDQDINADEAVGIARERGLLGGSTEALPGSGERHSCEPAQGLRTGVQ